MAMVFHEVDISFVENQTILKTFSSLASMFIFNYTHNIYIHRHTKTNKKSLIKKTIPRSKGIILSDSIVQQLIKVDQIDNL